MRLLTIILVLFSLSVQAQFTGIGNKKFRRLTDFSMPTRNFGADTVKAISIIDTSRSSGLILISKDSTAMYPYADTMNMYTTAKAWKFTPSLPCCVPDTIDLNFITTQCTTVTSNRWRPVITDSLGRASTTACDTISYLYVDTIDYGANSKYKVYTALLTQSDTFPPTAIVLENSLGVVTYSYLGVGQYQINCTGCFTNDKTFILFGSANDGDLGTPKYIFGGGRNTINNLQIAVINTDGVGTENSTLNKTSIEIRVYK